MPPEPDTDTATLRVQERQDGNTSQKQQESPSIVSVNLVVQNTSKTSSNEQHVKTGTSKLREMIHVAKLPQALEVSMVLRTLRDMRGNDGYVDFSKLEVERQLGTGAFGTVFLCQYHSGGMSSLVAVKQLHYALLTEHDQAQRFLAEAQLLRKLRHSCIVDFIGVGCESEQQPPQSHGHGEDPCSALQNIVIVQEYCNCGTLKDLFIKQLGQRSLRVPSGHIIEPAYVPQPYITPTQYSYTTAHSWLICITKALVYLHSASPMVIHRDIKPENILFQREKQGPGSGSSRKNADLKAKIGDFGLAAMVDARVMVMRKSLSGQQRDMENLCATKPRVRSFGRVQYFESADECFNLTQRTGSVLYMAPEVMQGEHYNEKCDIFSLGIIIHELMTGIPQMSRHVHFNQAAVTAHVARITQGHRQQIPGHLPRELQSLISRCWHSRSSLRPQATEVLAELELMQPVIEEWEFRERKCGLFCC